MGFLQEECYSHSLTSLKALVGHSATDHNLKGFQQQSRVQLTAGAVLSPLLEATELQETAPATAPEVGVSTYLVTAKHFSGEPTHSSKPLSRSLPKCHAKRIHDKILHCSPANPIFKILRHWAKTLHSSSQDIGCTCEH